MFRRCSSRLYRGSQTLSAYGLSIGIGLFVFFVLAFSVCANEYELQYKVSDLRKEGMYTSGQFLRPSVRPEEKLSAEPKYRSKTPVYAVVTFGSDVDSKYTIVLDESKGTGRGYVDGNWYSLDIPAHGNNVEVQTPSLKFGIIKIPNKPGSCSLQLVSSNGILKFEETGKEFQVPADVYKLYAHTTQVKDSSVNWRYEANGTSSGKQFQVSEGDVLELSFGAPLLVNVSYYNRSGGRSGSPKVGNTIELSLTLSGQGGEVYTNVQKGHDRPPAPTFVVVDESGKNVAKGTFEYG